MHYQPLGRSGLMVSELCLGTMIFGEDSRRSTDAATATRMIHQFLDAGGNFIDTADVYAGGRSEEITGQALHGRRDQVVLATKVFMPMADAPNRGGLSRKHIQQACEASLRRLNTDWIDLLLIHWPDHNTSYMDPIRALDDLKQAGKIRHYGVSNFSPAMMQAAESVLPGRAAHLTANQIGYNMFDRRCEHTVLPYCQAHGIGFMAYGTLCYGLLTGALAATITSDPRPRPRKAGDR